VCRYPNPATTSLSSIDHMGATAIAGALVPAKVRVVGGVAMSPAIRHSRLPPVVNAVFDDIDAMAAAAREWDQEYEQIGRGRFRGELIQLLLSRIHVGRERWSPGVLQRGPAPKNSWVFGLPLMAKGSLHVRRRPVQPGELLAATWRDDVGFAATGPADLMVIVLPDGIVRRWMQARRGVNGMDPDLPPRHWAVSARELALRSNKLATLLDELLGQSKISVTEGLLSHVEAKISDTILDIIPSAEVVEAFHGRARIAREVLQLLHDRRDDPPTVTEMCELVGARERTLFLSCIEAFGRPPAQLLLELRLNAVRRALVHPVEGVSVTSAASHYGFTHFGRFSSMYLRQFDELPSATLAKSVGPG
jgi:AraC family ethanolamine operon transcriptional activator